MSFKLSYYLILSLLPTILAADEVTLNFKKMDINQFIELVSEVTGKTFVVDPRVRGEITVISGQPMNADQIYEVFLSTLNVHGFSAITTGEVTKIIPDNLAKSENIPLLPPNETLAGETIVTQVVQVKHVSAAQLLPLLRPLIRQQGHLVAYAENNTLIISDSASNVQRLLTIIQRIDKPEEQAQIEIIMLEHAFAADIVRILTAMEQQQSNATTVATTMPPKLAADERTNSVLISGDTVTRLRLRMLIAHLDTPVSNDNNTQVIYLRYAQAKDLIEVLKGVSDSVTQGEAKVAANAAKKDAVKTNIQADEVTNSLIITATPSIMQNLQAVIHQLDMRRAQVLVEAVIAEVSTDMARELGVQWLFYGNNGTTPIGLSNFDNVGKISDLAGAAYAANQNNSTSLPNLNAGTFLGLGRFGSEVFNFALLLKALSADTNTNVLSTPSLLTLDNQEAEIIVGQNVPFVTGQYTSTGTATNVTNPFQTIQREDIGIKLKVKPQINEGSAIKLKIEQEVSSISRSSVATTDIVTNKRTIKTTVIVEDGKMIVLGGLIDEDLQQTAQKVPGLGDLPLIGGLFRSQTAKKVKRNLMVFLHPVIMREGLAENILSGGKYQYMRHKQLQQQQQGSPLVPVEEIPVLPNLDDFLTVLPGDRLTVNGMEPRLEKNQ